MTLLIKNYRCKLKPVITVNINIGWYNNCSIVGRNTAIVEY